MSKGKLPVTRAAKGSVLNRDAEEQQRGALAKGVKRAPEVEKGARYAAGVRREN